MKQIFVADVVEGRVAPFTGAWIETLYNLANVYVSAGRPLHGGVD